MYLGGPCGNRRLSTNPETDIPRPNEITCALIAQARDSAAMVVLPGRRDDASIDPAIRFNRKQCKLV